MFRNDIREMTTRQYAEYISSLTGRPAKIPNSPEHCFIYNDKVNGVEVPKLLDKQWYIDFATKRLKDFGVVE